MPSGTEFLAKQDFRCNKQLVDGCEGYSKLTDSNKRKVRRSYWTVFGVGGIWEREEAQGKSEVILGLLLFLVSLVLHNIQHPKLPFSLQVLISVVWR